jgi:hypothetical protein
MESKGQDQNELTGISLRLQVALKEKIETAAKERGMSTNRFIQKMLQFSVDISPYAWATLEEIADRFRVTESTAAQQVLIRYNAEHKAIDKRFGEDEPRFVTEFTPTTKGTLLTDEPLSNKLIAEFISEHEVHHLLTTPAAQLIAEAAERLKAEKEPKAE